MKCHLCRRWCLARRRNYGRPVTMTGRFCARCRPMVEAADVDGVVQVVEAEFSTAFRGLQRSAA